MTSELNQQLNDLAGCNITGRIKYALRLLEGGDIKTTKRELKAFLKIVEE